MSNVASLKLCKELYELSAWEPDNWYDLDPDGKPEQYFATSEDRLEDDENEYVAAYDLGYLLRKLPATISNYGLIILKGGDENPFDYKAGYGTVLASDDLIHWSKFRMEVDAPEGPEDALVALATELFKKGVLTKADGA